MTSKVIFSRYSLIVTNVINVGLFVACGFSFDNKPVFYTALAILLVLLSFGCIYGPIKITSDSQEIVIKSIFRRLRLPMRNVESATLFQPTLGAIRICGSGGYFGYWGMFKEGDIGKYTAAYGKASDCFLIRMKNGDKYVLGCENPEKMIEYINSQLPKTI